jgi:hypothetical protein
MPLVIAAALNWLVVGALFGVGVRYLVSNKIMDYHLRILDVDWTDLTPRTRLLILTFMKGTGLAAVCTAVSLTVLLAVPFRAGETWSRWAIMVVGATALVPTLIGAIRLRHDTGASSPWWPHVALLAALGLAFGLTGYFGLTGL